ncbi:MAG: hypothetical protein HRU05_02320 [Oceanospirillaceae bacterium]|nr:hypothetical protein [Oceanospirillaceae bacterium]
MQKVIIDQHNPKFLFRAWLWLRPVTPYLLLVFFLLGSFFELSYWQHFLSVLVY